MALLTVTGTVRPVFLEQCRIRTFLANAAITAGQSVYMTSTGKVDLANAATSGHEQFRGVALETVGAGQGVDVLEEGFLDGTAMGVTGLAYDALVYQSDTSGTLADAAGTKTVQVGRVVPAADANPADSGKPSKLLYVRSDMIRNW